MNSVIISITQHAYVPTKRGVVMNHGKALTDDEARAKIAEYKKDMPPSPDTTEPRRPKAHYFTQGPWQSKRLEKLESKEEIAEGDDATWWQIVDANLYFLWCLPGAIACAVREITINTVRRRMYERRLRRQPEWIEYYAKYEVWAKDVDQDAHAKGFCDNADIRLFVNRSWNKLHRNSEWFSNS